MLNYAQKSTRVLCLLLCVFVFGSGFSKTPPPPLSGTKYIGTGTFTQNYATLTAAFADITTNTLGGNLVLVLQSGYSSAGETLPIVAPAVAATGSYSVTIYPDADGRAITGSSVYTIIDLNDSKNIIIDGRVNGTGSTKSLIIENTNTVGATIRLMNDACNNTIKYCTVKGVTASNLAGVIYFSTSTATTGNDDNTIDNCDIRDGATTPANGIFSAGTGTKENGGNTISNCNIYNFFSAASSSSGIYFYSGNDNWTITGNSFYQTASRTATVGNTHYGIQLNTGTTSALTISNNYFGGGAPQCGSTAWTILGAFANKFIAISLTVVTPSTSSIQGNTISNFNLSTTSNTSSIPGIWCGIYLNGTSANIGTVTGNTIGSSTGTGSIQCTTSGTGGMVMGIAVLAPTCVANITNNTIGSITASGSTTSVSGGIIGIICQGAATLTVNNNLIGSTNTANSLWANTAGSGTTGQAMYGIYNLGSSTIVSITNNTIANFTNAYAGTGTTSFVPVVRGIYVGSGTTASVTAITSIPVITGNTIYRLVSEAPYTGTGVLSAVMGILVSSSSSMAGNATINQNTIHSLQSTATAAAVSVCGINYANAVTAAGYSNQIQKNNIHSLFSASSGVSVLRGITVNSGRDLSVSNNMVRLGLDTSGTALTGNYDIVGISDVNTTANYYHNSVYIGGTGVTGTTSTYAFNSTTTTNARNFRNNIFVNERSNGTGTGVHYAVAVGGTTINPTGLTMSNNIYFTPGAGGKQGRYNATDYTTLSAWQAATGVDYPSASANPNFITPAGSATTGDLHLTGTTPAEGTGVDVGVTDDFDGQTRSGLTPVDIGADAGNFTANDLLPPAFSLTALLNIGNSNNRTISATVTDGGTGVPTTGSLVPRVWFRIVSPSATAWGSTAGTLSSGNGNSGVWSFTIDYTQIGTTPTVGDSIQYYFVAQDQASTPNIGFNTFIGAAHTNVNTQTTAPTSPLGYKVVTGLATSINVGTGETYTSLTGAGGLFATINSSALTGNTTVNVTSDLLEDGVNDLTGVGLGGYTLTIQPSSATLRIISNSADLSVKMLRLNGVTGVTFDGRSGGSGQYLRIINTKTNGGGTATIEITGSSTNVTIRNCIIENNSTFSNDNCIYVNAGANTGITISNNDIRSAQGSPGTAGIPGHLMMSNSALNVITVTNNNFYNFIGFAIFLLQAADQCVVTGNSIYYNAGTSTGTLLRGISIGSGNNHTVNNNYIGGSAPNCGGSPWVNSGSGANFTGIQLTVGTITTTSVQGNTIQNISFTATNGVNFNGILVTAGNVDIGTVTGNTVGHPTTANSIQNSGSSVSGTSVTLGIGTTGAGTVTIKNNTIANMHSYGINSSVGVRGISNLGAGQCTIQNNSIFALSSDATTSGAQAAPVGILTNSANTSQVISGNTIYNLTNRNTTASSPTTLGISTNNASGQGVISGNRIYGLTGKGTTSPSINGIYINTASSWTVSNNMISLSDSASTTGSVIAGIRELSSGFNKIYYNTVYIFGSTGTTANSYAYYRTTNTNTPTLANNIFYNERTAGTGIHYAIGNTNSTPATGWTSSTSNYNLYVTVDSTKTGEWGTGITQTLTQWRTSSGGDANSYYAMTSSLSAANLFTTPGTADLHINTANSEKSYVENKGTYIAAVTADYDGHTRSLTVTELGADELAALTSLLRLTAIVEGLYNTGSNTMIADTMKVYLRRTTTPYTVVDSSTVLLSTAGQGVYTFAKQIRDSSFYLQLYNKRALETWSKTGVLFNADTVSYDFTTAANKAYGDNQALRGTKYCLYSGDVNQDGVIDLSDIIVIDNDNANFVTGDAVTDLNGDGVVDLSDLLLADNNNANFIARVTPLSGKRVVNPRPVKVLQQ